MYLTHHPDLNYSLNVTGLTFCDCYMNSLVNVLMREYRSMQKQRRAKKEMFMYEGRSRIKSGTALQELPICTSLSVCNHILNHSVKYQVLKVSSDGRDRILVTLGEAFTPGSDNKHFCQPTDVAVDTVTGNIFISDGYCNARILKFSADGKYLSMWGAGTHTHLIIFMWLDASIQSSVNKTVKTNCSI